MYFLRNKTLCTVQLRLQGIPVSTQSMTTVRRWSLSTVGLGAALLLGACGGGNQLTADPSASVNSAEPARALAAPAATVGNATTGAISPGGADARARKHPGANLALAGEIIVQLNVGTDVSALAGAYQLAVIDQFGKRPIWRLRVAPGASVNAVIATLRADAGVRFAEPNFESETPESRRRVVWAVGGDSGSFGTQWAPTALRLAEAHSTSVGLGMRVAVLDSGIDLAHPALAGRLAIDAAGSLLGRDFVDDDVNPSEGGTSADLGFGHGTHVAGLVSLVAPGATLMPVRVLDAQGRGNLWVLAEALTWAVDPDSNPATDDGAHVINLSLATTQRTNLMRTAVALANCDFDDDDDEFEDPGFDDDKTRCANKFGAVVLAAAGNAGNSTELQFPAAEGTPGLLAVTASTELHTLAPFANHGAWVQIAAPGDRIVSTFPGGGYATWSGTSMASPLAAGTAALVLATFADPRGVLPKDIAQRLSDRSAQLCGTALRQIDAAAAVTDNAAPERPCP